ncbi:YhgE/Pip domain-containing protein [Halobacillus sp. BBL2006]|uniref:YhgE/Pip domain-containing protein n=1 Tax=Halobacillus sp. BBL2006 TaxID=1543706 RepID=UPI000543384A|nr:YhgE/Pip domain-containing protein [Halobacillus sp. BBL2006]KHE73213.1 hypothetical protein LD39_00425 [Halobacillus sp. BBL2006]
MNGFKLWLSELKSIGKDKKMLIPFLAVLMIPLIYSAMFLWAFWNPYGSMDQLPVAIVNSDEGAEFNGEPLDVGGEFVDNLEDSGDFKYDVVSKEEGYQGLEDQQYYMLVEIPENFSSHATTVLDEKPEKLQLKYVPNEGFNFLSAQIGESATEQMKAKLSSEMTETYANAMFTQFNEIKTGLADASDKAGELNDGAAKIDQGAEQIKEKLQTFTEKQLELADGTQSLRNGASELASGSAELNNGLAKLNDGFGKLKQGTGEAQSGAQQLKEGLGQSKQGATKLEEGLGQLVGKTSELEQGAAQLNQSIGQLQKGSEKLSGSAGQLSAGLGELKKQMTPLIENLPDEQKQALLTQIGALQTGASQIADASQGLSDGASQISSETEGLPAQVSALNQAQQQLKAGASELSEGQSQLYTGAAQLVDGENQLYNNMQTFASKLGEAQSGSSKLASGASDLNQGASQVFDGSNRLADGSQKLQQGASDLSEGTNELTAGTDQFENELTDASTEANKVQADEETGDMMAKPVDLDKEAVNSVPNYGTGFTPYFLSLGLFVGALLLTIVYPVREPVLAPKNAFSWFISKFGVLLGAGIIQAVVAASVILYGLGLEVASAPYFYLFSIITSLTFMALVQMLVTLMGDPGRFVAIIILILQLTTSAGTFPLELIPEPLQAFNPLLPMTYSVSGYKAVISDGNFSAMWQDASVLGGFIIGSILITITYFVIKFKKTYTYHQEKTA